MTAPVSLSGGLAGSIVANFLLAAGTTLFWNNVFRGFVGESAPRAPPPFHRPDFARSHAPPSTLHTPVLPFIHEAQSFMVPAYLTDFLLLVATLLNINVAVYLLALT